MRTREEFREFCETSLGKYVAILEEGQRLRRVKTGKTIAVVAVVLLLAVGIVVMTVPEWLASTGAVLSLAGMLGMGVMAAVRSFGAVGEVGEQHLFKALVIGPIVRFYNEALGYKASGAVDRDLFVVSGLFPLGEGGYRGSDLVRGLVGKTAIEFSEVDAFKVSKLDYDALGQGRENEVFRGLFFVADFNKHVWSRTVVLPRLAGEDIGLVVGRLLEGGRRTEVVKLEDPRFMELFEVYAADQVESRYALSTSLMERLVRFQTKVGSPVYVSFFASKMFIAIRYDRNPLDPSENSRLLDMEAMERYFDYLEFVTGIVEDMNLNTRIWSKA